MFGAPLAVGSLGPFFVESTFIGIGNLGWDGMLKRVHLLEMWIVTLGTMLSGFWILTANWFMPEAVGYKRVMELSNWRVLEFF